MIPGQQQNKEPTTLSNHHPFPQQIQNYNPPSPIHTLNAQTHTLNVQTHNLNVQTHLFNVQTHLFNVQTHLFNVQTHEPSIPDTNKQITDLPNLPRNGLELQLNSNGLNNDLDEERPFPNDSSLQQSLSNQKSVNIKSALQLNELPILNKKQTSNNLQLKLKKQREKKIKRFITDFQSYLPPFLDQLHREHHKSIIRIGSNYQVQVDSGPKFSSIYRPMKHLRIWNGAQEKFNQEELKRFRQIYGENRTEEELILFKNRFEEQNWSDLIKQLAIEKQAGKKPSLVIISNSLGVATRPK